MCVSQCSPFLTFQSTGTAPRQARPLWGRPCAFLRLDTVQAPLPSRVFLEKPILLSLLTAERRKTQGHTHYDYSQWGNLNPFRYHPMHYLRKV